jgi:hypothetical protein
MTRRKKKEDVKNVTRLLRRKSGYSPLKIATKFGRKCANPVKKVSYKV